MRNNPSLPKDRSRSLEKNQREYDRLRRKLAKVGYLWMGTILRRYIPCGSQKCSCRQGPDSHHGPYYYWTRKVKGKTVSRLLTTAEGELYSAWAANRQQLQKTINQMYRVSEKIARSMLVKTS